MLNTVRSRGIFYNINIVKQRKHMFGSNGTVNQSKQKNSTNNFFSKLVKRPASKRNMSTISVNPAPGSTRVTTNNDIQDFLSVFPDFVSDLTEIICDEDTPEFKQYYERMLNHLFPNKTFGIGHLVARSYKMLAPSELHTLQNIRVANILGWCMEMSAAAILIGDDIRDGGETRLGAPCWHLQKDVGLRAIIDAQMISNATYLIIKKYCSGYLCYVHIIELYQTLFLNVVMGQTMDEMCNLKSAIPFFELFTMDTYNTLIKYKTAQVYLVPLRVAMYLANISDPLLHEQVSGILLKLGSLWQIENDILECFGDPLHFGKNNTDISKGSCTWPIVKAIEKATLGQRQIIERNYGKSGHECEKTIRSLYDQLDVFREYISSREQQFELIRSDIGRIQNKKYQNLFYKICEQPVEYEELRLS